MSHNCSCNSKQDGASNKMPIGIPQNLIKNFNPYEVLEPIKVENSQLLVDLNDSTSSQETCTFHSQMSTDKSRYTLVDLLENIYVTPQFLEDKSIKKEVPEIDYEGFFSKYDNSNQENQKTSRNFEETKTDSFKSTEKGNKQIQMELEKTFDHVFKQPHHISSINYSNYGSDNIEIPNALDNEDLIEELLLSKSTLKLNLSDEARRDQGLKVLTTPIVGNSTRIPITTFKEDHNIKEIKNTFQKADLTERAKNVKENHFQINKTTQNEINRLPMPTPSSSKLNNDMILKFLESMECKDNKVKTRPLRSCSSSSTASEDSGLDSLSSSILSDITYVSSTVKSEKNLSKLKSIVMNSTKVSDMQHNILSLINIAANFEIMSVMPVQAAVKEQKEIAKHKTVINDEDKELYTRGPDLEEKKIVLPQILSRLGLQSKGVVGNVKDVGRKRFILDAGCARKDKTTARSANVPPLEPDVLMEDCNRKRLQAFKTRQMMGMIVKNGNILN